MNDHDYKPSFPCAKKKPQDGNGNHDDDPSKKSAVSKIFIPSYRNEKEIMARVISHDYGRQWLTERDAWHAHHSTSDESVRARMIQRSRDSESRNVDWKKCQRELEEQIARGRLAGSKKKYKNIKGVLNTHWNPYPPLRGWRC